MSSAISHAFRAFALTAGLGVGLCATPALAQDPSEVQALEPDRVYRRGLSSYSAARVTGVRLS